MKVLAGDFKTLEAHALKDRFVFGDVRKGESILYTEIETIEVESDESRTKGGLGLAVAGGLAFGGAGAVTGAIIGRKTQKESVVGITFLDGRRLMANLQQKELVNIKAALFDLEDVDVEQRRSDMAARTIHEREKRAKKAKEERIGSALMVVLIVALAIWFWPSDDAVAPSPDPSSTVTSK